MSTKRAKQYYLPEDVIEYLAKAALEANRTPSNYLTTMLREQRDARV